MKRTLLSLLLFCGFASMQAQEQSCCGGCKKNPVIEAIMTRTSVRQFEEKAVSEAAVETLLRAGMAAPTAVNRQPWHFVVVTDKETLKALGGRAQRAPLAIAVCGDMEKAMEGMGRDFWVQDCSAASENVLLAAHALGLGAVWTSCYPNQERCAEFRKIMGLAENLVPLNVIAIGYPAETPEPKDKWKPENITRR